MHVAYVYFFLPSNPTLTGTPFVSAMSEFERWMQRYDIIVVMDHGCTYRRWPGSLATDADSNTCILGANVFSGLDAERIKVEGWRA